MIYMARIATERGIHWYCIGECDGDEDAMAYAKVYTRAVFGGLGSQVKEVKPKIKWLDELRGEKR